MANNLQYRHVLVVEDEAFIALDMAATIEDAHGTVVGPVGTVHQALKLIEKSPIDAAILDINLADGDVGPVLEKLASRNVFVVLHSGRNLSPELAARFPNVPIFQKPIPVSVLVHALTSALTPLN